jgi:signal peptide peptidase SppA
MPERAHANLARVINIMKGNGNPIPANIESLRAQGSSIRVVEHDEGLFQISEYGGLIAPEDAPADSIAVIDITDVITKYDQECGPAGMLTKADLIKRCDAAKNINAIILNSDSGGGEGGAARLMNETIKGIEKPVFAYVSDMAASAAYYIASACDYIVANSNVAIIGSIGTYMTIADYSGMLQNEGIRLIEVYADASADKNKEYYDALKGDVSGIKALANRFNDQFIFDIASNREKQLTADAKAWGTGKLFNAKEAMDLGLIDNIGSMDDLIQSILNF